MCDVFCHTSRLRFCHGNQTDPVAVAKIKQKVRHPPDKERRETISTPMAESEDHLAKDAGGSSRELRPFAPIQVVSTGSVGSDHALARGLPHAPSDRAYSVIVPHLPGLSVVRSSIDGYGVVATRPFVQGELIAQVDGVAWRDEDGLDDRYSLWIEDGLYFDMVDQTRWINHSCDPNAHVHTGVLPGGEVWAKIVAGRSIAAGEEIAYDYAFPAHLAEPCRCGSEICRGMIIDEDAMGDAMPAAKLISR
jgi:SET domain